MALIRDVTAKEREIHSSIIVLLDVRKEATMCIIPVVPISKFTRILTSTGKLFAGEGSLQNNSGIIFLGGKFTDSQQLYGIARYSEKILTQNSVKCSAKKIEFSQNLGNVATIRKCTESLQSVMVQKSANVEFRTVQKGANFVDFEKNHVAK